MKQHLGLVLAATAGGAWGLHVTQWQDSMTILPGHFIELINNNEQDFLSAAVDSKTQLQQDLSIDLVSKATALANLVSFAHRQTTT